MKYAFALIFVFLTSIGIKAQLSFSGAAESPVEITPNASTGLEAIYVIRDCNGVSISYPSSSNVSWSKFGINGAAYSEDLGTAPSIALQSEDAGYVATVDGRSHYFWIVNYANHQLSLNAISPSSEQTDCDRTAIDIDGIGDRIVIYSINGRSEELSRDLKMRYYTLTFDADNNSYRQIETVTDLSYVKPTVSVDAPLCDTRFVLTGDRFLEFWNAQQTVESNTYTTNSVMAETTATQQRRDIDNEQRVDAAELGGSAPCDIDFTASVTDAAAFYEWQLSRNPEFDPIDDRYPQTDLSYTFRQQGTTYVRFVAADASGKCDFTGPVYQVMIGESSLLCPNAFTPQSTPGINDEWKVSYKSIVSFECHIFNRWGQEMFSFKDPSMGWDGKHNGKYVPAGTYYYVIKAVGSDGKDYKLSGDINIINSKNINNQYPTE